MSAPTLALLLLREERFDVDAIPAFLITVAVGVVLAGATRFGLGRLTRKGGYRGQLAFFFIVNLAILGAIATVPLEQEIRKEVLQFVGIALSATLALSSTTFLGNLIAGGMLRTVGAFDLGDWVRVGDHFGRVTFRGLLHTEIQTADRDLTTLPNLMLATEPVKVVRKSGTIISASVGIGYDVPHARVEERMIAAAEKCELTDCYVAIDELGDFAVTYRVAGKLEDVELMLSRRSKLRREILDFLHEAGIEIMSPHHRVIAQRSPNAAVIPTETGGAREGAPAPETVAFDKADRAAQVAKLRERADALRAEAAEVDKRAHEADADAKKALHADRDRLREEAARLDAEVVEIEKSLPESD